jgi:phosphatidylglycerol:prolipoprotein diacylglycerol transferase
MLPLLFHLGPIPIYTYGFMVSLGFLAAVICTVYLGRKSKLDVESLLDLTFWLLLSGFVGARLLFVITQWSVYRADPGAILRVWEGGFVFYGGLLVALPVAAFFISKYKLPHFKTLDSLAPGLAIAHSMGRLGCFAAGCCHGLPTDSVFGVRFFSSAVDPSVRGLSVHPVQLYEATALFVLFLLLLWYYPRKRMDGQITAIYLIAYPVLRFFLEYTRGDSIRGFIANTGWSTSQFISAILLLSGFFFWRFADSRMRSGDANAK